MDCKNIKEKLSAYIEGDISSEEKMLVDEHLRSCQKCNESLAELKKTVDYVRSLEDIEPPAWLLQKVMAGIKSGAKPGKGIWQKLFYPLHIKLPIEAVTAILIAVTAMYIFKNIQPEMKFAKVPSEETTPRVLLKEKVITEKELRSKENVIARDKVPKQSQKPETETALSKEEISTPSHPPLEKGVKGGFEASSKASAPIANQDQFMPSAGSVARDESKRRMSSPSPQLKSRMEKRKDSISLTVYVKDINTTSKEIEKTLTQLGGKITETESLEDKNVLSVRFESKNLNELITKLKIIGEVKEKEDILQGREGEMGILIEIVKITR